MRKKTIITALVISLSIMVAPAAMAGPPDNAGSPTCAGAPLGDHGDIANHGEHVIEDYVREGEPGARGGPAHFSLPAEIGPGASFCLTQAQAESPSGPPGS